MKKWYLLLLVFVVISVIAQWPEQAAGTLSPASELPEPNVTPQPTVTPEPTPEWVREGWELVWQDEFDGETLNQENWMFDIGAGGWGNSELQYYTDRPENVRLENGVLVIEAREEKFRASDYTSARIKTEALHSWTYGRFEARLKLPFGKGIWPAFWMLGDSFAIADLQRRGEIDVVTSLVWPNTGEIDVMENIGDPNVIYGTLHGPGYSGGQGIGAPFGVPEGELNDTFHIYVVEWYPDRVEWYFDDVLFNRVEIQQVPGDWVYNHPFFLILNLAVGGVWPGYPDETTVFPQQLVVDYVRVYQDPNLEIPSGPTEAVHIEDIEMALEKIDDVWQGTVTVTVVDSNGQPVEGAFVEASWVGAIRGADTSGQTNADGLAGPFVGQMNPFSDELSFCVVDLDLALYGYDKSQNNLTCLIIEPEAPTP